MDWQINEAIDVDSTDEGVRFTCFKTIKRDGSDFDLLVAGRNDGQMYTRRLHKQSAQAYGGSNREQKDAPVATARNHQGAITTLMYSCDPLFSVGTSGGLLFTGSADRTIKVWDIWADKQQEETCVQTLVGHGATVTAVVDSGYGSIISCACDCTFRIWQPLAGREMLLHAFFTCTQTVSIAPSGSESWANTMALMASGINQQWSLYVGDAGGHISVYQHRGGAGEGNSAAAPPPDMKDLVLHQSWTHLHSLGVTALELVIEHNFLISLSFDCTCAVIDASTGTPFLKVENPRRVRYTGMVWDNHQDQLVLCDHAGYFQAWNTFTEHVIASRQVVTPMDVHSPAVIRGGANARAAALLPAVTSLTWLYPDTLICLRPQQGSMQQWKVARELKELTFVGHEDEVVAIALMPAPQISERTASMSAEMAANPVPGSPRKNDEVMLFSASLDNSMRCWDEYDVTERFRMREEESEISCMIPLPHLNLLVTGNDDGSIRWWNPDLGSLTSATHHDNTVCCLAHAPTAREEFLLSGSYDGSIGLWVMGRARDGRLLPHQDSRIPDAHGYEPFNGAPVEILAVEFFPLAQCYVSGGNDSVIRCWSSTDLSRIATLRGHTESVTCLAVDANFLFSGSEDGTVLLWNLSVLEDIVGLADAPEVTLEPTAMIDAHPEATVHALLMLPSLGFLATCGSDSKVNVWDYTAPAYDPAAEANAKEDGEEKAPADFWPPPRDPDAFEKVGKLVSEFSCGGHEPRCLCVSMRGESRISVLAGTKAGTITKVEIQ